MATDRRRGPPGRGARLRVALGLRPHAGRPAARGGADLRAVRRARGNRGGDVAGAARTSRPRRRVPERRADRQDDLDARRGQRRAGGARDRGRLEGGRVAGLRLRVSRRAGTPGDPRRPPRDHHPHAGPGPGDLRGPSRPGRSTPSTSRKASSSRGSRSSSAATARRSPGGWPHASPTSSTSTRSCRTRSRRRCP